MPQTPIEIMESAYLSAEVNPIKAILSDLPNECVQDLKIIVENAEMQKAVLYCVQSLRTFTRYSQASRKYGKWLFGQNF